MNGPDGAPLVDPLGLFGSPPANPFAPTPAAGTPPAGAPPAGDPQGGGAPPAPAFVALDDFNRVKGELESLNRNLGWVGEAMAADPSLKTRLARAIFDTGSGAGAPPSAGPPPGPVGDDIKKAALASAAAKIAAGDVAGALGEVLEAGSKLTEVRLQGRLESAAGPLLSATGMNTIESWYNTKRATDPVFGKIEPQVRAFVAQTPPQTIAALLQNGSLYAALDSAYDAVLAKTYRDGYTKALASGAITAPRPEPPPYALGSGGGPTPHAAPTDDDKDDAEFVKWAREKGIDLTGNATGSVIVGTLR